MSGHSKWATIKRKKGAADAKRGQTFTKLVREITTAARMGGGDRNGNPRLRAAIVAAKAQSMPSDNVERAIKKGTGELDGVTVEEISYEGYGPNGVAFYVEAQTDNKNRTAPEIRMAFTKAHGKLGSEGSVAWMFKKLGRFVFDAGKYGEDELMNAAVEAGADDVTRESDTFVVSCDPRAFGSVADHFDKRDLKYDDAGLGMIPDTTVSVSGDAAEKVLKLMEALEELEDVQKVYANFDIADAEMDRIAKAG